jgi:hypothetical protein
VNTRRGRFIAAAFNQGAVPTIACFNKATTPLGFDLTKFIAAMQKFLDDYLVPVWGTPATLVQSTGFKKGAWALVFLDTADVADALGYHDLTPDGLPLSKVFVKTTQQAGEQVTVTATHELAEMMVDPAINLSAVDPKNVFYAYETADAVEALSFNIDGFAMSDFVHPAYFESFRKSGSAQFDHLKKVKRPFQILPGGYMSTFKNGSWTQIFGSKAKAKRFRREDRRGHRTTYLGRTHRMRLSTPL